MVPEPFDVRTEHAVEAGILIDVPLPQYLESSGDSRSSGEFTDRQTDRQTDSHMQDSMYIYNAHRHAHSRLCAYRIHTCNIHTDSQTDR